jgi:hypothetical protein
MTDKSESKVNGISLTVYSSSRVTNAVMPPETDGLSLIIPLLADTGSAIRTAEASAERGQPIDLSGLDRTMALLCAKALDLQPPFRRQAARELATLREPVERLFRILAERNSA